MVGYPRGSLLMSEKLFDKKHFSIWFEGDSNSKYAWLIFKGDCSTPDFVLNTEEMNGILQAVKASDIFIDANEVEHVNSRFIGMLIALLSTEKRIGLKTPTSFLNDLLEIVGIVKVFEIRESFEEFTKASV